MPAFTEKAARRRFDANTGRSTQAHEAFLDAPLKVAAEAAESRLEAVRPTHWTAKTWRARLTPALSLAEDAVRSLMGRFDEVSRSRCVGRRRAGGI